MPGAAALDFEGDLVPTFDHPANTTPPDPSPSRHHMLITLHGSLFIELGNRGIDRLNYGDPLRRSGRTIQPAASLLHPSPPPPPSPPIPLVLPAQQPFYNIPAAHSLSLAINAVSCNRGLKSSTMPSCFNPGASPTPIFSGSMR
ncbi:hypothetical protein XPA_004929 [Xanthoria parietina]